MKTLKLCFTFLIIILLLLTKYTKINYYLGFLNIDTITINKINVIDIQPDLICKCSSCINLNKLINNSLDCCKSCKCSIKNTLKYNLYYISPNQIKQKLFSYINKILYSFFHYIINIYFFRFFLEVFIIFLYDTFILILNKYSLFLFSIKLTC